MQEFHHSDLSFLQPSVIHVSQPNKDSISPEKNTIAVPLIATQENNLPQEQDTNTLQVSPAEVLYDRNRVNNTVAPIQPVEPVVSLTPEKQCKKEEDPDLTLIKCLTPCEGHITTPLQTLDGIYVNQPSRFLPLAQEAKKLAKKLKEEEETSQWSGIPIKKLLNESFTEQLNYIQVLQQIAPLHSAREHLPLDIIRILERLGKVETTPFNKLYYLAQNCTDHYYMKVIQTFVELIKRNTANKQIVLVNTAQALKYLETYGQRQSQLFTALEKYHQVLDNLEDLKSQFHFLKEATSRNVENLQQALKLQQTYTTTLCNHINVIFSRMTKLEADIQKLTEKFMMEQDTIKIDAPDFDSDIDRPDTQWAHHTTAVVSIHELFTSPQPKSADAINTPEETTDRDQLDTKHSNSEDPHRPHNLSQQISDHSPEDNFTGQQQVTSTGHNVFNEVS